MYRLFTIRKNFTNTVETLIQNITLKFSLESIQDIVMENSTEKPWESFD